MPPCHLSPPHVVQVGRAQLVVVHDRVVKEVEERREEVLRVWEVVVTWEEVAADEVAGEQVVGYITVTSIQ